MQFWHILLRFIFTDSEIFEEFTVTVELYFLRLIYEAILKLL